MADVTVSSGRVVTLGFGYDVSDATWKAIPLYNNQLLTIVSTGAINIANFPSTIDVNVTNFPTSFDVNVTNAKIDTLSYGYDIKENRWKPIPLYRGQLLTAISTGIVSVANFPTSINANVSNSVNIANFPEGYSIVGEGFLGIAAISTGYVNPGTGIKTAPIPVYQFKTKTVHGWANFNGTLKIYTSYLPGQVHPYPYSTTTINSGTTFTVSFTDSSADVVIEIDNTSSTGGLAFVGLSAGVV
jgi:hypothetical protein